MYSTCLIKIIHWLPIQFWMLMINCIFNLNLNRFCFCFNMWIVNDNFLFDNGQYLFLFGGKWSLEEYGISFLEENGHVLKNIITSLWLFHLLQLLVRTSNFSHILVCKLYIIYSIRTSAVIVFILLLSPETNSYRKFKIKNK